MECGLGGQAVGLAYWTGAARTAAFGPAIKARRRCDVGFASFYVVAVLKRVDRASCCTGLVWACQAGLLCVCFLRCAAPANGTAEGYEKPGFIVYKEVNR